MNSTLDSLAKTTPTLHEHAQKLLGVSFDTLIWSGFYALMAIFAIYSALLLYHWLHYGKAYRPVRAVLIAYFLVSSILVTSMLIAAWSLT